MLLYSSSGSAIECDRSWDGIGLSRLYPLSNLGSVYVLNDIWAVTTNEDKEISDENV